MAQPVLIRLLSAADSSAASQVTVYCVEVAQEYISNTFGEVRIRPSGDSKLTLTIYSERFETKTAVLKAPFASEHIIFLSPQLKQLETVTVTETYTKHDVQPLELRSVEDMYIYSAKKSERIDLKNTSGNLSTNNSRQIYSKVPGLNIFESNGAGLNTEIGGRGLSPERSTNFNMRQNGYDISADALGYPDAYYVPPSEGLKRIEVVRGAGALQYGTQFGGMINYKLKTPEKDTPFQFKTRQTGGSFGFFNSFNAVGGKYKKWEYYAFYIYKRGDGWRPNSEFYAHNAYGYLKYNMNEKWQFTADFSYFNYLAHQPGGLTDKRFKEDPTQSIRERNWFNVDWNLPSFTIDYKPNAKLQFNSKFFGLVALRNASGFLGNITRTDPLTERDLLKDNYRNWGNETKMLKRYTILGAENTLVVGTRFYQGNTHKQQGLTTDGYGPDFYYLHPDSLEGSDYTFPSQNIAVFAENMYQVTPKLKILPGIRFEHIQTSANGYYRQTNTDIAGNPLLDTLIYENLSKPRSFVLLAVGASYKITPKTELYGNFSQNYRAINFNDMRISNPNFKVDPNLQDETGYNFDIGLRGTVNQFFAYDVSAFFLKYNNRIGFVQKVDTTTFTTYRFRTNISESNTFGLESVVEVNYLALGSKKEKAHSLKHFVNLSLINGSYVNSQESAINGNQVELVPNFMIKTGLKYQTKQFEISGQITYTGEQFTDATNSTFDPSAVSGIIPSYIVMDMSAKYFYKKFMLEANLNNILDESYFTRRAAGYPGPGIIPAEPRSLFITLGYKL